VTRREDLRRALGRVRRSPSLVAAGWIVSLGWVVAVLGVGAATPLVESAAGLLLVAAGQGRKTYWSVSVPESTHQLLTVAIELVLLAVALELLWTFVTFPLNAAMGRLVRDEADGLLEAVRSTVRDLPRLVGTALLHRGLVALWLPVTATLALAVYLSLGTALEALGYAVGLYWYVPAYVAPVAIVGCLAVARRAAATVAGSPDPAVVADSERSIRSVAWTSAVDALERGRRTALDGTVEAALLAMPIVAVVVGVLMVELTSSVAELVAAAGSVVAFVAAGALAHSTASVFRLYRAERRLEADVAGGEAAGGTPGDAPDRSGEWDSGGGRFGVSGSTVRIGLLVAVVVVAGVAGAGVRYADATPGDRQAGPPGAVTTDDDPDQVVREGMAAADRTSHTQVSRSEYRRLYDNGTTGEWRPGVELRIERDRDDEQVRVDFLGETTSEISYVDQVTVAYATFDGTNATDEQVVRSADWVVFPVFPGTLGPRGDVSTPTLEVPDDGEMRVAGRTGDRVVVESTDPRVAAGFAEDGSAAGRIRDASVRIELEAETGYVRRIEVEYVRPIVNEPDDQQVRWTIRFEEYGSTDVERPPGVNRGPVSELLDVLYY